MSEGTHPGFGDYLGILTADGASKPCFHYRQNKKMEWANQFFGMIGVEMEVVTSG